eukprot:15264782-Ditylum_brightwellii.AAC.1
MRGHGHTKAKTGKGELQQKQRRGHAQAKMGREALQEKQRRGHPTAKKRGKKKRKAVASKKK